MKKIISIMIAFCLLLPWIAAQGEIVRNRVEAPTELKTTYTSPSGKSHVYVDASVVVPDVERIPLYRVTASNCSDELADRIMEYFHVQTNCSGVEDDASSYGMISYENRTWNFDTIDLFMFMYNETVPSMQGHILGTKIEYYSNQGKNTGHNLVPEAEALVLADAAVQTLFPGHAYYSTDKEKQDGRLSNRAGVRQGAGDYGYRFYFVSQVDGIPLAHVNSGINTYEVNGGTTEFNFAMPYEVLYVDVGQNGIFQILWQNPFTLEEQLTDNCTILSFEEIMQIFGTIAPLKAAIYENTAANNNYYIDRIELSYMILQEKNNPLVYTLTPVWDFFGARTIDRERYDFTDQSLFTINAIDGTVIDRDYGY